MNQVQILELKDLKMTTEAIKYKKIDIRIIIYA